MKGIKVIWVVLVAVVLSSSQRGMASEYEQHKVMVSAPANCSAKIRSQLRNEVGEMYITVVCKADEAEGLLVQQFPLVLNGADKGYAMMITVPKDYTFQTHTVADQGVTTTQIMVKQVPYEQRLPVVKNDSMLFPRLAWGYLKHKIKD